MNNLPVVTPKFQRPDIDEFGIVTEYSADSIESCPHLSSLFVCGTYQLFEEQKLKVGKLYLNQVSDEGTSFEVKQTIDVPAILDLKWSYQESHGKSLLGQAGADGSLKIFSLDKTDTKFSLDTTFIVDKDSLCLSLDWNNRLSAIPNPSIAVSLNNVNESIAICEMTPSGIEITQKWKCHEFETWIVAWNYHNPHILYSGADDCTLKGWDIREDTSKPLFSKSYSMGVTTIQSSPHHEHLFAVGSYDDSVSIWDQRIMRKQLMSCDTKGGVWRVKWHPQQNDLIATASMRAGFHVLKMSEGECSLKSVSNIRSSCEPIAYGIDWICQDTKQLRLATCSFYDHFCSVWNPSI